MWLIACATMLETHLSEFKIGGTIWWTDFEAKNENDLEISDVESGLSIHDFGENDDIIEETGSNGDDIERPMTTVPVLTKDKLVRF